MRKFIILLLVLLFPAFIISSATLETPELFFSLSSDISSYAFGFSNGLLSSETATAPEISTENTVFSSDFSIDENSNITGDRQPKTIYFWWKIISKDSVVLTLTVSPFSSVNGNLPIVLSFSKNHSGNSLTEEQLSDFAIGSSSSVSSNQTYTIYTYSAKSGLKWGSLGITASLPESVAKASAEKYTSTFTLKLENKN